MTAIRPTEAVVAGSNLIPTEIGKASGRKLTTTVIDATKDEGTLTTGVWMSWLVLGTDYVAGIVVGTGVFDDVFAWSSG